MSAQVRLLACPFCGCAPKAGWQGTGVPGMDDCGYYGIDCCHAFAHADDEQEAVAAWNQRTPPSAATDARQNGLDVFNRAARDLPKGYEIAISIEPGSASVYLLKAGGGSEDCYSDGSTVEQQVDAGVRIAIDTAIRAGGGE